MELRTRLERDRFFWTGSDLADRAFLLIEIEAPGPTTRLTIVPGRGAGAMQLLNDVRVRRAGDSLRVDLDNSKDDPVRSLILQFEPKRATRPGRRKLVTLHLDDLHGEEISRTIWLYVARDSERSAVVDREVAAEVLLQRVQRFKRDTPGSHQDLARVARLIRDRWPTIPRNRRPDFEAELDDFEDHSRDRKSA